MNADRTRVLLIGYGNPGRLDDGLGQALADAIEKLQIPGVTVDAAYQLSVEDAAAVAEHDVVVFADADTAGEEPFGFRRIEPKRAVSFSSHSVQPAALLALTEDLFGRRVEGYLLGIRGYEFNEYAERLSEPAKANLLAAISFIEEVVRERAFCKAANGVDPRCANDAPREEIKCKTTNT